MLSCGFSAAEFNHHFERFMHEALGCFQNVRTQLDVVSEQDRRERQTHFHVREAGNED